MSGNEVHPDLRRIAVVTPRQLVGPRTLPVMRALIVVAGLRMSRTPPDIEVLTLESGVGVRLYRPAGSNEPAPALLWIHAGGYVMGTAQQDDRLCLRFSSRLGITVASVDYRLAPENPYPAALGDCYSALTWLASLPAVDPARVAIGGASAGGGLIFVPGGAWVHGSRAIQGYAVLSRLAAQGWVCLSIDYRVAPHHRWPRHILDVKTAIAWARANVDKFGGDRNFIAVAGCSAGGHLSALAGLTANDPQYQAELPEGSDTSVDAVVGIYGRYDWEDRSTPERARFVDFLERVVVQRTIDRHPEVFRDASPIQRVTRNAPPFLVIHGSRDCVIPVEQARSFVERLRAVSRSQVGYLELPGAGHGFDLLDGARTGPTAHAIALFLNQVHRSRAQFAKEVI